MEQLQKAISESADTLSGTSLPHDYIADILMALSRELQSYDSPELISAGMTLTLIGAEIRKRARPRVAKPEVLNASDLKPTPKRSDPNSKIPRPSTPPRGGAPAFATAS